MIKLKLLNKNAGSLSCLMRLSMFIVIAFIAVYYPALPAEAQEAPPQFPALCYGELSVNGQPAPVGTVVEAKIDGTAVGKIVTTEVGWYGGPGLQSKLLVSGDNLVGKTVRFYVSGTFDGTEYSDVFAWEEPFWGSGEVMQINIGVSDVLASAQPDPPEVAVPNPLPVPTEEVDQYPELSENSSGELELGSEEEVAEETDEVVVASDVEQMSSGWSIGAGVIFVLALVVIAVRLVMKKRQGLNKGVSD
jgi:hypothetical protein